MYKVLLLILAVAAILILYQYTKRKRIRKKRIAEMRTKVENLLPILTCLDACREIGSGKKGIVYSARLGEGWKEQMGVLWRTSNPLPERVAVKIFPIGPADEKVQNMLHLAPRIEEAVMGPEKLALCPFLAIGEVKSPSLGHFLIELMPMLEGETLSKHLKTARLSLSDLEELLRVLKTSAFFDRERCFERSIDNENVMALSDGSWIRIDIDSTRLNRKPPRYRIMRMSRLVQQVLQKIDGFDQSSHRQAIERIQCTAGTFLRKYEGKPLPKKCEGVVIETPEELIAIVEGMMQEKF